MSINVELFRKIQKEITEEPKRLDMGVWLLKDQNCYSPNDSTLPPCGTVGCIAGWAKEISFREKVISFDDNVNLTTFDISTRLLGISEEDAINLFHTDYWPEDLQERYFEAHDNYNKTEKAKVTCEAIDRVIEKYLVQEQLQTQS